MSRQIKTNPDNESSHVDGTRTHLLIIDGEEASDRDYARVMNAQGSEWTEEEIARDQARYNCPPLVRDERGRLLR